MYKHRDLLQEVLQAALIPGECTCIRCRNGEDKAAYKYPHEVQIKNKTYRRVFGVAGNAQLRTGLEKAYKEVHGCLIPSYFDSDDLLEIVSEEFYETGTAIFEMAKILKPLSNNRFQYLEEVPHELQV